ncbi:uncharacterized protein N7506_009255 [Penicillium brevicompactum]|uniref:uncharacterized protein n=1 Tax=Penicillium brevicompactum TaxID=5074 RepID=UPI002541BB2D|nr:uncharacterized protein N7506_009255 [Penicillium brevicompactum]KAJ5326153.1 hypothetical protein N7506_009255 [Penicillium brevicompactum]
MPSDPTESLSTMPEDANQADTPDQVKMQGNPPLLRLPIELLLSVVDLLDEVQTPCLALTCTKLWSVLTPTMAKQKSKYRDFKQIFTIRRDIIKTIVRDLPNHQVCLHCLNIHDPSKTEPRIIFHEGDLVDPKTICERCGSGMINRALEFQINWDKRYKMLYRIRFSDVQLAIQRFADKPIEGLVPSLCHTQVTCLEVNSVDPDEGLKTDKHTMLTSIQAMIAKAEPDNLPRLLLRIQHVMTARARKRDHTIMDGKELPHPCFHGDIRWWINKFTREPRKRGPKELGFKDSEFRNRTYHVLDQCIKCQVDFQLDVVNERSTGCGFTLVLTRWVNLGPGLSPEDLEWKVHSECCPTTNAPYGNPRDVFESRTDKSCSALQSSNLFYLQNENYRGLMENSNQDPDVWVLRSPRQDSAYQLAKRIRRAVYLAGDASETDEYDDERYTDETDDSDQGDVEDVEE